MADPVQEENYLGIISAGWGALADSGEEIVKELKKSGVYSNSIELTQQADTYIKALKYVGGTLDVAEIGYGFYSGGVVGGSKEIAEWTVSRLVQGGVTVVGSAFLTPVGGIALGLAAGALTDFLLETSNNDPIDRVANFLTSTDESEITGASLTEIYQRDDGSQFEKVINLDTGEIKIMQNGVQTSGFKVDLANNSGMESVNFTTADGKYVEFDFTTGDFGVTVGGTTHEANITDVTVGSGLDQLLNDITAEMNTALQAQDPNFVGVENLFQGIEQTADGWAKADTEYGTLYTNGDFDYYSTTDGLVNFSLNDFYASYDINGNQTFHFTDPTSGEGFYFETQLDGTKYFSYSENPDNAQEMGLFHEMNAEARAAYIRFYNATSGLLVNENVQGLDQAYSDAFTTEALDVMEGFLTGGSDHVVPPFPGHKPTPPGTPTGETEVGTNEAVDDTEIPYANALDGTIGGGPRVQTLGIAADDYSNADLFYLLKNGADDARAKAFGDLYNRALAEDSIVTVGGEVTASVTGGGVFKVGTDGVIRLYGPGANPAVDAPLAILVEGVDPNSGEAFQVLEILNASGVDGLTTIMSENSALGKLAITQLVVADLHYASLQGVIGDEIAGYIANKLADGDVIEGLLYSATLKAISQNLDVFTGMLADGIPIDQALGAFSGDDVVDGNGIRYVNDDIITDTFVKFVGAAEFAIAGFLVGEVAEALDLDGIGGGIVTTVGTAVTVEIVGETFDVVFKALDGEVLNGLFDGDFSLKISSADIANILASYVGKTLAGEVVQAENEIAGIFGSLGGAVGTAIAAGELLASTSLGKAFGLLANAGWAGGPLGVAIGVFVGQVAGTLLGNAFGGGADTPNSWGRIEYDPALGEYKLLQSWGSGGGTDDIGESMALQTINGINAILDATHGKLRTGSGAPYLQVGLRGDAFEVMTNGGAIQSFGTAADAVNYAAFSVLKGFDLVAGHAVVMRAWHNSDATNIHEFKDDIEVAEAFQLYLSNPAGILALMMDQPESDTAQAWAAILQRAAALELHLPHEKDLDGGWNEILLAQGVDIDLIPSLEGDTITLTDPVTGEETVIHHVIGPGYEIVRIEGTDGNDIIEVIVDGPSITYVAAGEGDDLVVGSDDADILVGGGGDDTIIGNDGNDWLHGGSGEDNIDGGRGEDLIVGADHDDYLVGGEDTDTIYGNGGDDYLNPGMGLIDYLYGGEGNDTLEGNANYNGGRVQLDNAVMGTSEITVSVSFRTEGTNDPALVSYAVPSDANELMFYNNPGQLYIYMAGSFYSTGHSFSDGEWHDLTVTWNGTSGELNLYDHGVLLYTGTQGAGKTLESGGILMLGQDQDSYGGGLQSNQAFHGELGHFTVWDHVLDGSEVAAGADHSDALHDFKFDQDHGITVENLAGNGDARLIGEFDWGAVEPSDFVKLNGTSGNTGHARLDNASIGTNAMTISVRFKNDTPGEDDILFDYATSTQLNAIQLNNNPQHGAMLTILGQTILTGYTGFQDTEWHDLTVSWDGTTGAVKMYDNGAEVWSYTYNSNVSLDNNGVLLIGSYQSSYGVQNPMFDYEGDIARFTIWDEVLDGTEITNGVDYSDALNDFKFDAGAGSIVTNLAGNGDALLVGDYEWPIQAPDKALALNETGSTAETNAKLYGEAGDDRLILRDHDNGNGGAGDDLIEFSGVSSTAFITRGQGHDSIVSNVSDINLITFDETISANDLYFTQDGSDLKILVLGEKQSVVVQNYFGSGSLPNVIISAFGGAAILFTRQAVSDLVALHATISEQPSGPYNYVSDAALVSIQTNSSAPWSLTSSIFWGTAGGNTVDLAPHMAVGTGGTGNDVINSGPAGPGNRHYAGDSGDDYLVGSGGQIDVMSGGLGNDTLLAGGGNDRLYGGYGDDILHGHGQNDLLHGGQGNDELYGGDGHDEIFGGDGDDYVYDDDGENAVSGGDGNDFIDLHQNTNNDLINGDAGDDIIIAGGGDDTLGGDDGNDVVYGNAGDDWISGGLGNDELGGGDGDDVINGGLGNDYLLGGAQNDNLYGGDGNDKLEGGFGDDTLNGGLGNDTYYYAGNGEVEIWGGATWSTPDPLDFVTLNQTADDGYLRVDNVALASNAFTISMTIKNSTPGGDDIFFDYATSNQPDAFQINNNVDSAWIVMGGQNVNTGYTGFQDTEWHDLTVSWDGSTGVAKLYDNGLEVWSHTYAAGTVIDTGGVLAIGAHQSSMGTLSGMFDFEGDVSQVTLWDHTLDSAEISNGVDYADALYNYVLDEGTGATVTDLTGNNNATLNGDYAWTTGSTNLTDEEAAQELGTDIISDSDGNDTIEFGNNIVLADLSFERDLEDQDDLVIKLLGSHIVTVENQFSNDVIENILLDDGTSIITSSLDISLFGDAQNNVLEGTAQTDLIYGDAGSDIISASEGDDILDGGAGTDRVLYSAVFANYILTQGPSHWTVEDTVGSEGVDQLHDVEYIRFSDGLYNLTDSTFVTLAAINGTSADDALTGTVDADEIFAGAGNDNIQALEGDDFVYGEDGDDEIYAGFGDDVLIGGAGNDILDGGSGTDVADYSAAIAGVTVNLHNGTAIDGAGDSDTLVSIENINGSEFDDVLVGNNGFVNEIWGNGGNDALQGRAGDDILHGGDGNDDLRGHGGDDTLYGGDGSDIFYGSEGNDTIYGGAGDDLTVRGGDGDDVLYGEDGDDQLRGENGNDRLIGGDGVDRLDGEAGIDTADFSSIDVNGNAVIVNLATTHIAEDGYGNAERIFTVENVIGSMHGDTLLGENGVNDIRGEAGADTIKTYDGDDVLYGGSENDLLYGGNDNDYLDGGAGVDALFGQSGADTFAFTAGDAFMGSDNVKDFSLADGDKLDVSDLLQGYDPLNDLITDFVQITDNGTHSYLKIDVDGGADNFVQVAQVSFTTGLTDEDALETGGTLITV